MRKQDMKMDARVLVTEAPYEGLAGQITDLERHGSKVYAFVAMENGEEALFPASSLERRV